MLSWCNSFRPDCSGLCRRAPSQRRPLLAGLREYQILRSRLSARSGRDRRIVFLGDPTIRAGAGRSDEIADSRRDAPILAVLDEFRADFFDRLSPGM